MPGIVGFVARSGAAGREGICKRMLGRMVHESFYASGQCDFESIGAAAGWVALANSFSDCMPVWNERRDVCLIFSGEDYQAPAVLEDLRLKQHAFLPENAAYLVHLYEEQGLEFLKRLNGIFSGFLVDFRERKAILFNDRYGLNRLYYHENDSGFYFASEAKSLLAVLPTTRDLQLDCVGELLSLGCVLGDKTLFKGISLVPAGSAWIFEQGGRIHRKKYFDRASLESTPSLPPEDYYEALKETWRRIVPQYFRGPSTASLSLTGGVDSRMVLAWSGQMAGTVPCYTLAGRYRESNDVRLSREIASRCNQPFSKVTLDERFLEGFPTLAERAVYLSDGTADARASCDLFGQIEARKIAPVRVSGVFGGEVLRRLVVFKPTNLMPEILVPELRSALAEAAHTYRQESNAHPVSFCAFKQTNWQLFGGIAADRSQITFRSPYLDHEMVKLAYATPPEFISDNEISLRLIAEGWPSLSSLPTDRGLSYPGGAVARARHALEQFTFKAEYAFDYGMPHWLASLNRTVDSLRLERMFLGRHKFYHFRKWYQKELSGYIRETLLGPGKLHSAFLERDKVERIIDSHLKGSGNYTTEIQKVLVCELIYRSLVERN